MRLKPALSEAADALLPLAKKARPWAFASRSSLLAEAASRGLPLLQQDMETELAKRAALAPPTAAASGSPAGRAPRRGAANRTTRRPR